MSQHEIENYSEKLFGENLKRLRGERSQAEMARFLGISHQQTYQRYEAGTIPRGDVLHDIATRLSVSVEELLTGKPPQPLLAGARHEPFEGVSIPLTEEISGPTEKLESEFILLSTSLPDAKIAIKKALLDRLIKLSFELKKRYLTEDSVHPALPSQNIEMNDK